MEKEKSVFVMNDYELAEKLYFNPERFSEVVDVLLSEDEISRLSNVAKELMDFYSPEEELGDFRNNKKINELLEEIGKLVELPEENQIVDDYNEQFNDMIESYEQEEAQLAIKIERMRRERDRITAKMFELQDDINRLGLSQKDPEYEELSELNSECFRLDEAIERASKRQGFLTTELVKAYDVIYQREFDTDDMPDSIIPEGMSIEEYSEIMETNIEDFDESVKTPLQQREEQYSDLLEEEKTIAEVEVLMDKQIKKGEEQTI